MAVPANRRRWWSTHLAELDQELHERRDGYHEAVVAILTLLLVEVVRFASDVVEDLKVSNEPLLAEVFAFIEAHYREPISLKNIAAAVGLTPGHLTTVVRRKTGRTVQSWIVDRRMAEARRLLVSTDQTVAQAGRSVGYGDPRLLLAHLPPSERDNATELAPRRPRLAADTARTTAATRRQSLIHTGKFRVSGARRDACSRPRRDLVDDGGCSPRQGENQVRSQVLADKAGSESQKSRQPAWPNHNPHRRDVEMRTFGETRVSCLARDEPCLHIQTGVRRRGAALLPASAGSRLQLGGDVRPRLGNLIASHGRRDQDSAESDGG